MRVLITKSVVIVRDDTVDFTDVEVIRCFDEDSNEIVTVVNPVEDDDDA